MKISKRIIAFAMAAVMAVSLSGCTTGEDTTWIMRDADTTIASGIYLQNMITAYYNAASLVEDSTKDILKQEVEGKDAKTWIADKAMALTKEYLAVERRFAESGLELTQAQLTQVSTAAENQWEMFGTVYEKNGISRESYENVMRNVMKSSLLFEQYYGEGGASPVPEEDYRTFFDESYTRSQFIRFPKVAQNPDESSSSSEPEQDAQEEDEPKLVGEELAKSYYDRAAGGENMFDLLVEIERGNLAEGEELHAHEDESAHDVILYKDETGVPAEYVAKIASMEIGAVEMFEVGDYYYVAKRLELDPTGATLEQYRRTLLSQMKSDEFDAIVAQWGAEVDDGLEINEKSVSRYTADKIATE